MCRFLFIFLITLLSACQPVGGRRSSLATIPSRPALVSEAEKVASEGNFAKAAENYNSLLKAVPGEAAYQMGLADVQRRAGKYDEAIKGYDAILAKSPQHAEALEGKGLAYLQQGQAQQAVDLFLKVLEFDAVRWKTMNALGVAYALQERHDLALEYYQTALQFSGDNPIVLNNMGLSQAFKGRYDQAELSFNRALVRLKPEEADKRKKLELNLSLVYGVSGKFDAAQGLLEKHFDKAQVFNNMGVYAHLANDNDLAKTYLNKALMQSPVFYQGAWDTLERIEPLTSKEEN